MATNMGELILDRLIKSEIRRHELSAERASDNASIVALGRENESLLNQVRSFKTTVEVLQKRVEEAEDKLKKPAEPMWTPAWEVEYYDQVAGRTHNGIAFGADPKDTKNPAIKSTRKIYIRRSL